MAFSTITVTHEMVRNAMIKILDERITRLEIAVSVGKHSKRKHKATKMLKLLKDFRYERLSDELPTRFEGRD